MKPTRTLLILCSINALWLTQPSMAELPLTGGQTTIRQTPNSAAFSQPAANLSLMDKVDFSVGNSFFRNPWVIAPSSTIARDGLGPLFNTNGCESCHIGDGRGHAPNDENDSAISMLIRLSVKAESELDIAQQKLYGPLAEPTYGHQLQDLSIPDVAHEGKIKTHWQYSTFSYPDGSSIRLRQPEFVITDLNYGAFADNAQFSARIAPQMIGLGLLEQIPEAAILANADPDDANGDGISGKANYVWDIRKQTSNLGRFGWKAGMPTLEQQNAAAFKGDIGITSELMPNDDCSQHQIDCLQKPNGNRQGEPWELQQDVLAAVTFYTRHLAVPMQRHSEDESVKLGQRLFDDIGCSQCHVSEFTTAKNPSLPALSEQTFHPFSDLLLHDMGEALADYREEFLANGREWRTPPLWGMGHHIDVSGQLALLHDGRAETIEQAILWHGGEAEASKQQFVQLPKSQRAALIAFLESL
ncbi:di-heme oxidoredictase family protein [Reinekea thalattae]|uniref:Thiol oxidoreductase n=1 Tax=Reinekea thalattae TaxID=2593301 RepID=A0A5C8Z576_9GAMM|nr:di-heme oxidoredictase family protein [Reinekea thalattae]TXR52070.1 thiol oxidoreductase [Reinekea thalattae]